MTLEDFNRHVAAHRAPAPDLTPALQALWQAAKGNWDAAHTLAQNMKSPAGSWIHAHLHRVEGDLDNAAYWYAQAGKPVATQTLPQEREDLIREFLPGRGN